MALVYTLVLHNGETHMTTEPTDFEQVMRDENELQLFEGEWNVVFDVHKAMAAIKALTHGDVWRHSLGSVMCESVTMEWIPRGSES